MAGKDVDIVIGAQDQASKILKDVGGSVQSFAASFTSLGPMAAGVGAAVGTAAAGFFTLKAGIEGIVSAADRIGEVTFAAQAMGASVDDLQAFQFAMKQIGGLDTDKSRQTLEELQKSIGEAVGGDQGKTEVFQQLQIDANALALQSPIDQFMDLKRALEGVENTSERTALAQKLLGDAGKAVMPVLLAESSAIEDAMQRANALGQTISGEGSAAVANMNATVNELWASFDGLFNQTLVALAPAIETIAKELLDWMPPIIAIAETYLPKIVDAVAYIADINLLGIDYSKGIEEARQRAKEVADEQANRAREMAAASTHVADKALAAEVARIDKLKAKELQAIEARQRELTRLPEVSVHVAADTSGIQDQLKQSMANMPALKAPDLSGIKEQISGLTANVNVVPSVDMSAIKQQIEAARAVKQLTPAFEQQGVDVSAITKRIEAADAYSREIERASALEAIRGKEAAKAYSLEQQGIDKATAAKIAAQAADLDIQALQKKAGEDQQRRIVAEAQKVLELKDKELQKLKENHIQLTQGKEAAHAFALEMSGLDHATAQMIASQQAAMDLAQAQKIDKTQGQNAVQSRLLLFGRGGDPKLVIMQQLQVAVNKIVTNTNPKPAPLPLTGRNYPDYKVAVVP